MGTEELKGQISRLMAQFDNQSDGADALIPILRQKLDELKASGGSSPDADRAEKFLKSKAA
jgi:hypothetical protein